MVNADKLKRIMADHGDYHFTNDLSEVLKISKATASYKLNGKKDFTLKEINTLRKAYRLSQEEIMEVFIDGAE